MDANAPPLERRFRWWLASRCDRTSSWINTMIAIWNISYYNILHHHNIYIITCFNFLLISMELLVKAVTSRFILSRMRRTRKKFLIGKSFRNIPNKSRCLIDINDQPSFQMFYRKAIVSALSHFRKCEIIYKIKNSVLYSEKIHLKLRKAIDFIKQLRLSNLQKIHL